MHSSNETFVHSFHLIHHVWEGQLDTLYDVAGYSLLAYDYFLNLNYEMTLIWPTPLNIGKALYLLVRYIPFIDGALLLYARMNAPVAATKNLCYVLYCLYGSLIFMTMIISEAIILFRTCALIRRTRRGYYLIYTLCFIFIGFAGVGVLFLYESFIPSKILDIPLSEASRPIFHSCGLREYRGLAKIFVSYIVLVCYETILFLFMLYYCLKLKKYNNNSRLITTLLRDGVAYYLCFLGISIINVCAITIFHAPERLVLFQQNLHSNFATRILINLRMAVRREIQSELSLQCGSNITSSREGNTGYLTSVIIGAETWFQSHDDTLDPDEPVSTN